jgi:pimeloyl-ACP methyl ester carboxylesterase
MVSRRDFMVRTGLLMGVGASGIAGTPSSSVARANPLQSIGLNVGNLQFDALSAGPEDGELLLCLHGFPQFKESWINILLQLGALGYHAVAVDQRGYSPGARPASISDYAASNLVADTLGFATALGVRRFHLVGHDRGGSVAWALARNHPEVLLSLTILSTPHQDAFTYSLASDPIQQGMSSYIQIFDQPAPAGENFLLANNAANLVGSYNNLVSLSDVSLYVQRLQQPGALTAALNWYRADNLGTPLGTISVPTQYIWGSNDAYLGKLAATATATFCGGLYRFVQLAGRSHWLLDEDPATVVTLLQQQFLPNIS